MSALRPRQVQAIAGAKIHTSLGGDFSVSPSRDSAGTDQSANIRKNESLALGFFIGTTMSKKAFIGPLVKCEADGCERISRYVSVHLCGKHEMRLHRYGDTGFVTSNEQQRKNCRDAALAYKDARSDVYRKLHNRHEHRVVAEQMLGRPLVHGEIVHHVDGNRHNNSPENLQVMSQSAHLKLHRAEMELAKKAKNAR